MIIFLVVFCCGCFFIVVFLFFFCGLVLLVCFCLCDYYCV